MDSTTRMLVNQIKESGYWRQGQTLGLNGWKEVNKFSSDWKRYTLIDGDGEIVERITAKDDDTAIKVFGELFRLDMLPGYEIHEKIAEYRLVSAG